jgi:outer membrane immunogenic protein
MFKELIMRKILVSLAASLAIASPALANEARVEARGGVIFGGGDEEGIAGIAAGYDYDLGSKAFIGPEVSADKVLEDGTRVTFGFGARAGVKLSEAGKLYAIGTYQTKPCSGCDEFWTAGAGYQHNFGSNLYGKVEYRHFIVDNANDPDAVVAGLGMRF